MDRNDRNVIDDLFGKLSEAERQGPPRDAEAEALIRERLARQPGAPYYMLQTIAVQSQALEALQSRVTELERGQQAGGGFLGRLFGGPAPAPRPTGHGPGYGHGGPGYGQGGYGAPGHGAPWGGRSHGMSHGGGGFMAGAAQTAVGVAGGVLLGNAVMGMFSDEAAAEEMPADAGGEMDMGEEEI